MNNGISIIVCCYNSAARLPKTLYYLAKQVTNNLFALEVIVVDNASTDNTSDAAKELWNRYAPDDINFRIRYEQTPGLANARKCGALEAKYEYIIFCDDDNWLKSDYSFIAYNIISANSKIGAAGGQSVAVTDADQFPDWFEACKHRYVIGRQADNTGNVSSRRYIWGAGMITRRSLFLQTFTPDYPSLLTGRNGKLLSSGEDTEYCLRLLIKGFTLYYDEHLLFEHFIPTQRLTITYRDKLNQGIDAADEILIKYYLAYKLKSKSSFNRLRLLLITPFRYLLSSTSLVKKRLAKNEKITFYYLWPFEFKIDEQSKLIKKLMSASQKS